MKTKQCPSCGNNYRKGRRVMMLDASTGVLQPRNVCATCAASSVSILVEPPVRVESKTVVEQAKCACGARAVYCVGCARAFSAKLAAAAEG